MTDGRNSYFILGVCAGAAGALLFAPRAGFRTRDKIARKAKEGQEFVKRQSAEALDVLSDQIDQTKKAAKVAAEGIAAGFEAGKNTLRG